MIIKSQIYPLNKAGTDKRNNNVSFGNKQLYQVVNNELKKRPNLSMMSVLCAYISAISYAIGGAGLWYDYLKEKEAKKQNPNLQNNTLNSKNNTQTKPDKNKKEEGVKTIVPYTDIGKVCLNAGKVGTMTSTASGLLCGISAGMTTMAAGESINFASGPIIETPIGTGLFGIGLASVFAGLALENVEELKLDKNKLKSINSIPGKAAFIGKNMVDVLKESLSYCTEFGKNFINLFKKNNIPAKRFFEDTVFSVTPKTISLKQSINKEGKVINEIMLKARKNYLMAAASLVLAAGGAGVVLFGTLLKDHKKAQKNSLKLEEAGFTMDNVGMTRFGLDKTIVAKDLTGKTAGKSFLAGGIVNAVSQFMQIDEKYGRATQWLGIALVFLGFGLDRGKLLRAALKDRIARPESTRVIKELTLDLRDLCQKDKMNTIINAVKHEKELPDGLIKNIYSAFSSGNIDDALLGKIPKDSLRETIKEKIISRVPSGEIAKIKAELGKESKYIFGDHPIPVNENLDKRSILSMFFSK